MSQRTEQIASLLKRSIAQVLQRDLNDPRVDGFVTITRVEVAKDLHNATVFVTIMPEEKAKKNLAGLQAATRHIGLSLRKLVELRTIPRLRFKYDEQAIKEVELLSAIHKASREAAQREAEQRGNPTEPGATDERSPADVSPASVPISEPESESNPQVHRDPQE